MLLRWTGSVAAQTSLQESSAEGTPHGKKKTIGTAIRPPFAIEHPLHGINSPVSRTTYSSTSVAALQSQYPTRGRQGFYDRSFLTGLLFLGSVLIGGNPSKTRDVIQGEVTFCPWIIFDRDDVTNWGFEKENSSRNVIEGRRSKTIKKKHARSKIEKETCTPEDRKKNDEK